MKRPGRFILTTDDIKQAIFVDYEGSKDKPPTLLGYMIDDHIIAAIVEPCFYDCRERYRAKHAVQADHINVLVELIHRAENEGRVIISWSEHDYNLMTAALSEHKIEAALLKNAFRNAIFTTRRWFKKNQPNVIKERNDLASMMEITGYRVPEKYGTNLVGAALRLLRKQLTDGRKYADLTPTAIRAWRSIVKHNGHDLKGMQHVLTTLGQQMAP
jgi:hypothetical protein